MTPSVGEFSRAKVATSVGGGGGDVIAGNKNETLKEEDSSLQVKMLYLGQREGKYRECIV